MRLMRDGTGPHNQESVGRGMGPCGDGQRRGWGRGMGPCGGGQRRGWPRATPMVWSRVEIGHEMGDGPNKNTRLTNSRSRRMRKTRQHQ